MKHKVPVKFLYNTTDVIFDPQDVISAMMSVNPDATEVDYKKWMQSYMLTKFKPLTVDAIIECVLHVINTMEPPSRRNHVQIDKEYLFTVKKKTKRLAYSRHLIGFFCYFYTTITLIDIASIMRYDNHTSILHNADVISNGLFSNDKEVVSLVTKVKSTILQNGYSLIYKERSYHNTIIKEI